MGELKHARSFRDLVAYQKARRAAKDVFEMTKEFPRSASFYGSDRGMVREDRAEYFVADD